MLHLTGDRLQHALLQARPSINPIANCGGPRDRITAVPGADKASAHNVDRCPFHATATSSQSVANSAHVEHFRFPLLAAVDQLRINQAHSGP